MKWLESLGRLGMRLGLERMESLLAALDHPDQAIGSIVHVGGTNGKGSVSVAVDEILRSLGRRTVRFTSPHSGPLTRALALDGHEPSAELLTPLISRLQSAAEKVEEKLGEPPTQYEVMTALTYLLCASERVGMLIQEVGLGGRLDATNAAASISTTVITNVSLDHTTLLGDTLDSIAREKAGIIRRNTPVITGAAGEGLAPIAAEAAAKEAPLFRLAPGPGEGTGYSDAKPEGAVASTHGAGAASPWFVTDIGVSIDETRFRLLGPGDGPGLTTSMDLKTPLIGEHQAFNASLAVMAAAAALGEHPAQLPRDRIAAGLAAIRWPGRLELFSRDPLILLDAGHNPAAMAALRTALDTLFPGRPLVLLWGMVKDKDIPKCIDVWPPGGTGGINLKAVVTTAPASSRAAPAEYQADLFRLRMPEEIQVYASPTRREGLETALRLQRSFGEETVLCVCGSTFLVEPAAKLLK